jgi:DMSO/TMAO reductase YedYZ molybdopterin-dependent catalytic subunit
VSTLRRLTGIVTRPFRADAFPSDLRSERVSSVLGLALGLAFLVCFATGLYSHALQTPPGWFEPFPRPAGLYRVTQGLHVTAGIATVPLLLGKLWAVYPKLFTRPPFTSLAHAIERVMLVPLVGGALFLLLSGVNNINLAYPYPFSFRTGHYAAAWITMGALAAHVGATIHVTRRSLGRQARPERRDPGAGDRRQFLLAVFGTGALVATLTVGQTFRPLRKLALLAPRRPDVGPQGFPVNRTAASVGLADVDIDAYRLTVDGPGATNPRRYSYAELRALPQHEATLPIACVEGWSASARWRGVRVRDLVAAAGGRAGASVSVVSMQESVLYRRSDLSASLVADPDTLLALDVEGEVLHGDHGFPCRLIAPNRPGVLQTKWVARVEVT